MGPTKCSDGFHTSDSIFLALKAVEKAQKKKPGGFQGVKSVCISITERREDGSVIEERLQPPAEWMGKSV